MSNANTAACTAAAEIIASALPITARVWAASESGEVRIYVEGGAMNDGDYIEVFVGIDGRLHREIEAGNTARKYLVSMLRAIPMSDVRGRVA